MRLLFPWVLCAVAAFAQELVVRGPEPEVVRLGRRAVVTVEVHGATEELQLGPMPGIDGLDFVVGRPVTSTTQTIADGQVVTSPVTSWAVEIEPSRAGAFDLPPFLVVAGTTTLKSAPLKLEAVRDTSGDRWAFVELATDRSSYHVQEPVRLRLRFGYDREFFRTNVLRLFRQRLDLPVQVRARWLGRLPGTTTLPVKEVGADGVMLVINDDRAAMRRVDDVTRDGRTFAVVELESAFYPVRSGPLVVPEALVRFAYATTFREDFINGRVPEDRKETFVAGPRRVLDVKPLPATGRPSDFTGAVGQFTVEATAEKTSLVVGEIFKLELKVYGVGNAAALAPPPLKPDGFHVYGAVQDQGEVARTFTYDMTPVRETVTEIPPIPWSYFDPRPPGRYRIIRTAAIPVTVAPSPEGVTFPEAGGDAAVSRRVVPGENDIWGLQESGADAPRSRMSGLGLAGGLATPWVLAFGVVLWRRARERVRAAAGARAMRDAVRRLRATVSGGDRADLADALVRCLALCLDLQPAAVIRPDLETRLIHEGMSEDLSRDIVTLLEDEAAPRYGGVTEASPDAERIVHDAAAFLEHGGDAS